MQRQRQELSQAVRQLTDNSNHLYNQMDPNQKKRPGDTSWMETDLDSNHSVEHARTDSTRPLFVDTHQYRMEVAESSGLESGDDLLDPSFAGLTQQERQEIKTVRIVKRESGRRQRESRERSNSTSINLDHVHEEDSMLDDMQTLSSYRSNTFEPYNPMSMSESANSKNPFLSDMSVSYPSKSSLGKSATDLSNYYPVSMSERNYVNYDFEFGTQSNNNNSAGPSKGSLSLLAVSGGLKSKTESIQSLTKSIGDMSPVFQSEAARQIIYEMSGNTSEENSDSKMPLSHKHRRTIPKEKRRHNTAPNNVLPKEVQLPMHQSQQSENDMNKPVRDHRV